LCHCEFTTNEKPTNSTCVGSSCANGVKDGSETDVDCGGPACAACIVGKSCAQASDCASMHCTSDHCTSSDCTDAVKDDSETDVDCGGPVCAHCATGKGCATGTDCVTTYCSKTTNLCVADHCTDGVLDSNEADLDCGGSCTTKCATGKGCATGADCVSTFCNPTLHQCVATQCTDGVSESNESDVDCGGSSSCMRCTAHERCTANTDCDSGFCCLLTTCEGTAIDTCASNHCHDGHKDGPETGVDCGGSCGTKCGTGVGCLVAADCVSGVCTSGLCK
jgi:hypothetical protein